LKIVISSALTRPGARPVSTSPSSARIASGVVAPSAAASR
jgi:hypothetical protein